MSLGRSSLGSRRFAVSLSWTVASCSLSPWNLCPTCSSNGPKRPQEGSGVFSRCSPLSLSITFSGQEGGGLATSQKVCRSVISAGAISSCPRIGGIAHSCRVRSCKIFGWQRIPGCHFNSHSPLLSAQNLFSSVMRVIWVRGCRSHKESLSKNIANFFASKFLRFWNRTDVSRLKV